MALETIIVAILQWWAPTSLRRYIYLFGGTLELAGLGLLASTHGEIYPNGDERKGDEGSDYYTNNGPNVVSDGVI
jgi:hypothetical protein